MAMTVVAAGPAALLVLPSPLQKALRLLPCCSRPPRASLLSSPWLPSVGGMCHVAVEALKRREGGGEAVRAGAIADKNVAETVKNIVELARRASLRRSVMHTNFVSPPVVKEATMALERLADIKAVSQGGYPQAERCRLSVGHPDDLDAIPNAVSAVRISGNFEFQPCSHGDFLGAILSTGVMRDKVGDILLQVCSTCSYTRIIIIVVVIILLRSCFPFDDGGDALGLFAGNLNSGSLGSSPSNIHSAHDISVERRREEKRSRRRQLRQQPPWTSEPTFVGSAGSRHRPRPSLSPLSSGSSLHDAGRGIKEEASEPGQAGSTLPATVPGLLQYRRCTRSSYRTASVEGLSELSFTCRLRRCGRLAEF
ncbi:hypothetical protein Taro_025575 [Colocasia esculenta]|uniref:Ribosome-associated protein quality control protein P2 RNA-binding domain-containing protein n=1 Tax=Colocasia esculenta TaxID=4460 RepID=A0A843V9P5_COLES|nr:hypothetical protein [Colocasia esculenta]